ncbi:MAG: DUF1015 domain-containing protein [Thermoleophilia bacterium]
MADVRPFRGLRYAAETHLDHLVAPPYDVLSEEQAQELRLRSPHNVVHVDLPVGPGEPPSSAAYTRAADTFQAWRRDGILRQDEGPAIYLVDQEYRGPDGRERRRRGFIARLMLADFSERVVLPHEKTHAGPKMDRLSLFRTTHADISQIFLLYPDTDGCVAKALSVAAAGADPRLAQEAHDRDGNVHHLVPALGDAAVHVGALLADKPLYIADGHHRYETALAYRDERRAGGDHSADSLMVYLCSMDDPGLTVFPTHRLIKRGAMPGTAEVLQRLSGDFIVEHGPTGDIAACRAFITTGLKSASESGGVFGLYFPREGSCVLAHLRDRALPLRLEREGLSPVGAGLTVTLLHYGILRDCCGLDPAHSEGVIDYVSDIDDAFSRLTDETYGCGAFINPTRVDEVRAIADRGETMPQKSTYFYPKLLSGLVLDALGE